MNNQNSFTDHNATNKPIGSGYYPNSSAEIKREHSEPPVCSIAIKLVIIVGSAFLIATVCIILVLVLKDKNKKNGSQVPISSSSSSNSSSNSPDANPSSIPQSSSSLSESPISESPIPTQVTEKPLTSIIEEENHKL